VFYHGKEKWNIPRSFIGQFDVSDEIKKFLLNYRYVLFDTRDWDFRDKRNEELKDNVFLLTALALMKSAGNEEFEPVHEIFKFWHEKGFTREKDKILFFLMYISETKDIDPDKLKKILEDTKIRGGDIMPTLAQRLRDEGKEQWMKEGKIEAARRMLNDNVSIENIVKYTGLTEQEVRALMH
jgi:predicted transposase/invertase (TIGR01784 family)